MCGLFGFLRNSQQKITVANYRSIIRNLMRLGLANERRGIDSGGFAVTNAEITHLFWRLGAASQEFECNRGAIDKIDDKTISVIGHTRMASTGGAILQNAHPFCYNNIIGAHNGMCYNFSTLNRILENESWYKFYGCDSQPVIGMLAKYPAKEALSKINGWMALSWMDKITENRKKIHLAKDNFSELAVCYIEEIFTLFWSSAAKTLQRIFPEQTVYELNGDTIYEFDSNKFDSHPYFETEKFVTKSYGRGFDYSFTDDYDYIDDNYDIIEECGLWAKDLEEWKAEELFFSVIEKYCNYCERENDIRCKECMQRLCELQRGGGE